MHILKVPFQHCLISVQALATEVLRTNTSLVVLNLESNRITRKGIKVLHQRVLHFTLNNLATVVHIPACWLTYETPTRLVSNYQGHIKQWEDSCINVFIMCRMKTVFLVKNVKKNVLSANVYFPGNYEGHCWESTYCPQGVETSKSGITSSGMYAHVTALPACSKRMERTQLSHDHCHVWIL